MADRLPLHALFGGTFDPIHYGHLQPATALASLIGLSRITLMPNNVPPHRPQPMASPAQRKAMVELAIAERPLFRLDERELQRSTPSYTADTLREWRKEHGSTQPLAFIIGQDSLLNFPTWYQFETILDNSHLIVCRRPGFALTMARETHQRWLERHLTDSTDDLQRLPCGKIYLAETPWMDISATVIRQRLAAGEPCEDLLPEKVLAYIQQQKLYQSPTPCR